MSLQASAPADASPIKVGQENEGSQPPAADAPKREREDEGDQQRSPKKQAPGPEAEGSASQSPPLPSSPSNRLGGAEGAALEEVGLEPTLGTRLEVLWDVEVDGQVSQGDFVLTRQRSSTPNIGR